MQIKISRKKFEESVRKNMLKGACLIGMLSPFMKEVQAQDFSENFDKVSFVQSSTKVSFSQRKSFSFNEAGSGGLSEYTTSTFLSKIAVGEGQYVVLGSVSGYENGKADKSFSLTEFRDENLNKGFSLEKADEEIKKHYIRGEETALGVRLTEPENMHEIRCAAYAKVLMDNGYSREQAAEIGGKIAKEFMREGREDTAHVLGAASRYRESGTSLELSGRNEAREVVENNEKYLKKVLEKLNPQADKKENLQILEKEMPGLSPLLPEAAKKMASRE